jgi:hypothetical protein
MHIRKTHKENKKGCLSYTTFSPYKLVFRDQCNFLWSKHAILMHLFIEKL